jgi:guanylate kinase
MAKAAYELKTADQFDRIIHNDNLEKALEEAENIVGDFLKL